MGGGSVILVLDMAGSGNPGAESVPSARAPSTAETDQPAMDRGAADVAGRRRRAVAAGHRGDLGTATGLLADPDPTVRAAAVGALARLGGLEGRHLREALADPDQGVRRRACEEAGRGLGRGGAGGAETPVAPGETVELLAAALDDDEPAVVEAATWALGEAGAAAGRIVPRLAVLAATATPLCREAAVAALGAIGDPGGLPAVLAALDDRPAVRRRATVALAAFEGDEAEAGLRRAAGDRDWQVRQAAEELLGDA
jgi:HEAT repeat protein